MRLPKSLIAACLAALLAACSSAPIVPVAGMSVEGMNAISTAQAAGFVRIRSDLYLPGAAAAAGPRQRMHCEGGGSQVQVTLDAADLAQGAPLCALALQAVLQARARHPGLRYDVDLHLYPVGTGVRMQRVHTGFQQVTVSLVAPLFDDPARTAANLVDLIAHEGFHALGQVLHDALARNERNAYYAGLCTQLAVLGRVSRASLPGAPLVTDDPNLVASSNAAYTVRREVWPWFKDGDLVAGSAAALGFQAQCDAVL